MVVKYYLKLVIVVILFASIIYTCKNSVVSAYLGDTDVTVDIIPESPKPYQATSVILESFATDLNRAYIEWRSNGVLLLSGTGAKEYSFTTKGPDTPTILDIIIKSEENDELRKRLVIRTTEMDLLWQAMDSHTPPFYKGKALPAKEGMIKVVALPIEKGKVQTNLSYKWKNNDEVSQDQSGFKKNSFQFFSSNTTTMNEVSVEANSAGGNFASSRSLTIAPTKPFVLFYKKSFSDGILYNEALTNDVFVGDDEFTIVAEPYFLSLKDNTDTFDYIWKINDAEVATPKNPREISMRPTSRGGYAVISIGIESMEKLLQSVNQSLRINL